MKRNRDQREADLLFVAKMHFAGSTQAEIAEHLGGVRPYELSRQQIGFDLRCLRERWREECNNSLNELKARESARIGLVEREAWAAWERSKSEAKKSGNPRFLEVVLRCVESRREMFGLKSPARIELAGANGEPLQPNMDDALERVYGDPNYLLRDFAKRAGEYGIVLPDDFFCRRAVSPASANELHGDSKNRIDHEA